MSIRISQFAKYGFLSSVLLILYNTLIPFRFYTNPSKIFRNIGRIEWIPFIHNGELVPLTDLFGNIVLFLPIGFFAAIYLLRDGKTQFILLKSVSIGFGLSMFIEVAQIFFKYRVSSLHDLITNTFGAFLGGLLAFIFLRKYYDLVKKLLNKLITIHPHYILFFIFSFYKAVDIFVPDTITLKTKSIELAWQLTEIIPFASFSLFFSVKTIIFYYLIGLFFSEIGIKHQSKKNFIRSVFSVLIVFILFEESIHVLFYCIPGNINNIILTILGFSLGLKSGFYWIRIRIEKPMVTNHFFMWLVFLLVFFVLIDGLYPFEFTTFGISDLTVKNFAPFYYYFKETSIYNIKDVLYSLTIALPLGGYICFLANKKQNRVRVFIATMFVFFLSLIVETGQLFVETRVMDVTDVLLMSIGGALGGIFHLYHKSFRLRKQSLQ